MRLRSGSFSYTLLTKLIIWTLLQIRREDMAIIVQRKQFCHTFYRLLSLALHTNTLQFLYEINQATL
jgi:hypothetical protein